MRTERRDHLATALVLIVPAALQDVEVALIHIKSGKVGGGVTDIEDAVARLKALILLADEACTEAGANYPRPEYEQ